LRPRTISAGATAFTDAMSEALEDMSLRIDHPRNLSVPYRLMDIRERVSWFLERSGTAPLAALRGRSLEQSFREFNTELRFADREDTHSPASWKEYCSLMANPNTYPDRLFMIAAAAVYSCQIVIFYDAARFYTINATRAFLRIFLFASDNSKHFNWGQAGTLEDFERSNIYAEFQFDAAPLDTDPAPIIEPAHLSNDLDIPEDRVEAIHAAHCGYTGHPGVEATVKSLIHSGTRWQNMTAHVAQFIKRCPTCNSSRLRLLSKPTSAASLRLHSRPLRRWHIDSTGAMGLCAFTGFTVMISFVCEVTQFTVLYGSRHGTALETAIALINLMGWLGLAESIHSDGGPEMDNYIWHQVQQISGLKHTFSVPHAAQSDGIVQVSGE
jgi:hypothetical protein